MLNVIVVCPERVIFEGRANSVILPGEKGVFEVLPFHRPLLSLLKEGDIYVDSRFMKIRRGIAKVEANILAAIVEEDG